MKKLMLVFFVGLIVLFSFQGVDSFSASLKIPDKYLDMVAGEELNFILEVKYPENTERKDLRINYEILNGEGELIAQAKVLKAIEVQSSFLMDVVIPENTKTGVHHLNVKITDYGTLDEEVSATFNVISSGDRNQLMTYLTYIFAAVLFVGILVIADIIVRRRRGI